MTGRTGGGNGPGPRDTLPNGARPPAPAPDTGPPAASDDTSIVKGGPLRRFVRIVNPLGLHHRVADRFSRTAGQYVCSVCVHNGDARADGKSLWDLILLVVMPGAEVVLEVDGPDAAAAVQALADILASPGGEDYTI